MIKLGIQKKLRWLVSCLNLLRFALRKFFFGFEYANVFLRRLDKNSIQLILRKNGAKIGKNCDIESRLTFHDCNDYSNLIVGSNCHIGKNCFFDLRDKIEICDNVTISMGCKFLTHQDLGKSRLSEKYPADHKPLVIESNVYIGADATILMGCRIGEASLIGAKSLVRTDVKKNSIVAGVPAEVIKTK